MGLCGRGLTHTFRLAEGHKGQQRTAVPGAVGSPGKADGATSATVCVCVSNLTAKRPYGHSNIYLFFTRIDGLAIVSKVS